MIKADRGLISPVTRFLISLVSSLFLHSSKPVTAAGFDWAGEEVSVAKADGKTKEETRHRSETENSTLKTINVEDR